MQGRLESLLTLTHCPCHLASLTRHVGLIFLADLNLTWTINATSQNHKLCNSRSPAWIMWRTGSSFPPMASHVTPISPASETVSSPKPGPPPGLLFYNTATLLGIGLTS